MEAAFSAFPGEISPLDGKGRMTGDLPVRKPRISRTRRERRIDRALQQPDLDRMLDRNAPGGSVELAVDRDGHSLDRVRRDVQPLSDLREGQMGGEIRQQT